MQLKGLHPFQGCSWNLAKVIKSRNSYIFKININDLPPGNKY